MTRGRSILCLVFLMMQCGCSRYPDSYPVPPQREPITGPEPRPFGEFVDMSDLKAEAYLVSDVSKTAEGTGWRWTYKRPELRFYVDSTVNRRFSMDFSIIPAAFEQTGPVTLSVFINNKLLGKKRCQRPGDYHFEAPVPPAWLNTDTPTVVVAQVDKLYTAPADGAQLGYTLSRAGFR